MYIQWIFLDNYSLANCIKNFMIFCAIFLLTRKIICAILEPQRENKQTGQQAGKENEHEISEYG